MERKGLSQILYLIIAASVLMMIAMVITFTATDTIGGLGGTATQTSCQDAISGKCTSVQATGQSVITLPSTCVKSDTNEFVTSKAVYDTNSMSTNINTASEGPTSGSPPYFVSCN